MSQSNIATLPLFELGTPASKYKHGPCTVQAPVKASKDLSYHYGLFAAHVWTAHHANAQQRTATPERRRHL